MRWKQKRMMRAKKVCNRYLNPNQNRFESPHIMNHVLMTA